MDDPNDKVRCLLCPARDYLHNWASLKQHTSTYSRRRKAEHEGYWDAMCAIGKPPVPRIPAEMLDSNEDDM